ncbi:MAG: hypothetical protein RSD47_11680, partial [Romboutsia sp.]
FEDKEYKLEYKEENNRTYASISINQELNNRETLLIKNEINSDIYQVDIDLDDNGKRVIEIHFKSPFELIKYD